MIGGGTGKRSRRSKHASSYDGKSPAEIRKVKKARKAALEKARRMNQSQQKADEEKDKAKARMNKPQNKENDRIRKKTAQAKAKAKARMNKPQNKANDRARKIVTRARSKQKREDMSCSFEKTKVWEVPGKDYYNDADFEGNPEVAVQLWYDNNGTWLLRESKWLVAYLHLDDMMSKDALESSRPVLTKLLTKAIRSRCTLIEVVHSMFDEEEWACQRKWQEDKCIEDSGIAALGWLDNPESNIDVNLIEDVIIPLNIDKAWADSLVGRLKMRVPNHGAVVLNSIDDSIDSKKSGERYICKFVGDDDDDGDCPKTCESIKECLCNRKCFRLTYEKVKEYVDKDQPSFKDLDLPDFPKECPPSCTPVVDEKWATRLIGLKLQVPEYWWVDDDTKEHFKGNKHWECEIDSVNVGDKAERYFILKCPNDPDDPQQKMRYPMAYIDIKKYVDEKHPTYSSFEKNLPPFQRDATPFVDWEHVDLFDRTSQDLMKVEECDSKIRDILRKYCIDRIMQIQERQQVTPEKQHELGTKFLEAQGRGGLSWGKRTFGESIDAPLFTCASCGLRDFDCDGRQYQYVDLNKLDILKLDNEKWGEHVDRMHRDDGDPLYLPVDKDGNTEKFKTSNAYSIWPQDEDLIKDLNQGSRNYKDCLLEDVPCGERCPPECPFYHGKRVKYFHLHPEFVEEYNEEDGEIGFKVMLCGDCHRSVDKKNENTNDPEPEIPELSIASGVDIGNFRRVGLTPLTLRERNIISKVRHYINVFKIEAVRGTNAHSSIKGCGIMFDHDSPQVVKELLTTESINGDVQLQFVNHKGEYDRLIARVTKGANVSGRAHVIYQWLGVLGRISKWYKGDKELQKLPPYNEFKQTMDYCNKALVAQAELIDDEELEKQVDIARDDYASVRGTTTSSIVQLDCDENELEVGDFPMRCVNVTDSNKTPHDNRADPDHDFLLSCAGTLGIDEDQQVAIAESNAKYEEAAIKKKLTKSFREEMPYNEFMTGDEGLLKAYPNVFLFGTAYDPRHEAPRLTTKQRHHLLMQFTCSAASCVPLIFHLFDQMQRHEVLRSVHAKTQDKSKWNAFVELYTSPEFQAKLQQASADPHSSVGREVMRVLTPMLAGAGKSVTFGAIERDRSKGEIMALGRRFGCAPTFLTFAIDDVNNISSIRLTTPGSGNTKFPSQVSGEIYEALRNGYNVEGSIPIPKTYLERLTRLTENPVGAALIYKSFVNDVMTIIIGGKSQSSRRTSFVSCDRDDIGITGTNIAYFGKTETTGRGSLHFHVVLWGGISPDFLELISDMPELCKRVGSILESMYSASLTKEQHVADLATKEADKLCSYQDDTKPTRRTMTPQAMQISPDPLDKSRFVCHVCTTVCQRNGIHQHTFTCLKGVLGKCSCRLCKPSGKRKGTLPVILEADEDKEDDKYAYKASDDITPLHKLDGERHPSKNLFPLSSSDPRTIVWEMKRPGDDKLKPLPEDDVTREDILQKLYQQMMSQSVDDGVLYDPPKDGNCLFRALLKGLERARPDVAEGLTTKALRNELMRQLGVHKDEVVKAKVDSADPTLGDVAQAGVIALKDLAEYQRNAREISAKPDPKDKEFDIREYYKEMRDDTPYKCKQGGCLEYYLFAKKYGVNVAIHSDFLSQVQIIKNEIDVPGNEDIRSLWSSDEIELLIMRTGSYDAAVQEMRSRWEASTTGDRSFDTDASGRKNDIALQYGVFIGDDRPTVHLFYDDKHYKLLRYDWPWGQFDTQKNFDESSCAEFREDHTTWVDSQVDSYDFVHDKNNLFHNLMQGLVIVGSNKPSNPIVSSQLTLRGLKRDLMNHLKQNPHQSFMSSNKNGVSTLENEVTRRLSTVGDKTFQQSVDSQSVIEQYANLIQHDRLGGDELEMHLFAKAKNVNVILYDQVRDTFVKRHKFDAHSSNSETIHLLYHKTVGVNNAFEGSNQELTGGNDSSENVADGMSSQDACFTLFMPKLYSIMKVLMTVEETDRLQKIYDKISDEVKDRNGLVVDYNPLLTALLGCNTNLLFLGSKEQSRGALFYIGPYINKNGVEIIDALPVIAKAQDDALTHRSVAEDSGTEKRTVQHTLQKTLNRMNSKMEISDTQAAGALFGLDARMTSEIFSYYDAKGYKNFVLDTTKLGLYQNLEPMSNVIDLEACEGDDEAEFDADESSDDDDEDGVVEETDREDDVEDTWATFEDECCEETDMLHEEGAYGSSKVFNLGEGKFHVVSYPELYRYRGPELKNLNRLEYCALVSVTSSSKKDREDNATQKRKRNRKFEFGCGLKERIGLPKKDGSGPVFYQILRAKQCTPKLFCKMPAPPGRKPEASSFEDVSSFKKRLRRWRKQADTFAFHYLTMFRAEEDLYESGQDCKYKYKWEDFLEFESKLRCSDRAIDHSRLEQIDRYVHGWKVDTSKRMMLANYRGRNRTIWKDGDEFKRLKREAVMNRMRAMETHSGVFDYETRVQRDMSEKQADKINRINKHRSECVSIIRRCLTDTAEERGSSMNTKHPAMTLPLNEDSYTNLKEAKPVLDTKPAAKCCPVPQWIIRNVDEYLEKQDLSKDKDQAVKLLRDHFTAMHEGRVEDDDYKAPYLLICGGPGNGKSKLVETFDGIASRMGVGSIVKSAFVGGAAVNIDGSSLIGLFDIPVIDKDGTEEIAKRRVRPWNEDKRRAFIDRFPLDRISCIIVDEISTVKPYVLAYLNERLMQLYPDSGNRPFGGRAVVLLGDFDQLPPVGGDSLAGAAMKYEETLCKKGDDPIDDGEDIGAALSGNVDSKRCSSLKRSGIQLFERVKYIKLTEQHRSKDPEHTALLEKMSTDGSLHPIHLKLYNDLSGQDMDLKNGEFAFATMVVTGNAERHKLNAMQAKRWASHHNTTAVRWRRQCKFDSWKGRPKDQSHEEIAMEDDCFYEMFVPGAAGYITENINTDIGLANGVEIKYHSLSFGTMEQDELFRDELKTHDSPVLDIDYPPAAINVELFADFDGDSKNKKDENKRKREEWTHGSLANDGRVVVQLPSRWGQINRKWKDESIAGSWEHGFSASTMPMKDHFPIEPAFAVTIYKAQGRTIRRLIIFVSQHPVPLLRMSWEGLYVALSRVKYRDHIRLAVDRSTSRRKRRRWSIW